MQNLKLLMTAMLITFIGMGNVQAQTIDIGIPEGGVFVGDIEPGGEAFVGIEENVVFILVNFSNDDFPGDEEIEAITTVNGDEVSTLSGNLGMAIPPQQGLPLMTAEDVLFDELGDYEVCVEVLHPDDVDNTNNRECFEFTVVPFDYDINLSEFTPDTDEFDFTEPIGFSFDITNNTATELDVNISYSLTVYPTALNQEVTLGTGDGTNFSIPFSEEPLNTGASRTIEWPGNEVVLADLVAGDQAVFTEPGEHEFCFNLHLGQASESICRTYMLTEDENSLTLQPVPGDIRIYPNPSSGEVNFELNEQYGNSSTVEVYDLTGRMVKEMNTPQSNAGTFNFTIDKGELPNGAYLYRIHSDKGTFNGKLIIE